VTPVPVEKLENGSLLMRWLFGERSAGLNAAVRESREIGKLARAIPDPEKRRYLEAGRSISEVEELTRPSEERVVDSLLSARDLLQDVFSLLGQGEISREKADSLVKHARPLSRLAQNILAKLEELTNT
jgi:hypothetical protein